nr:hypothetical protein CFP56_40707 [Quercus suber]
MLCLDQEQYFSSTALMLEHFLAQNEQVEGDRSPCLRPLLGVKLSDLPPSTTISKVTDDKQVQFDGHKFELWLSGFKPMNEFLDNNLIFYHPPVCDERGLRENQMLEVGGEVDFFFLELLFEILEEKLPNEFGFKDP